MTPSMGKPVSDTTSIVRTPTFTTVRLTCAGAVTARSAPVDGPGNEAGNRAGVPVDAVPAGGHNSRGAHCRVTACFWVVGPGRPARGRRGHRVHRAGRVGHPRRLLHSDPDSFQARKFGAGVSHRKHHLDPPELEHLLLSGSDAGVHGAVGISSLAWAVPLLWLTGLDVFPAALTAVAASHVGLANYEWTHLMVHTRYRPKTRFMARLARNHRLHHYRNEEHWLGVTSNLGDRILGTLPKTKTDVALSETARTLGQD